MTRKSYDNRESGNMAVMAGSFNPFTMGHLSVLVRGLRIFNRIVVLVGRNATKDPQGEHAAEHAASLSALLEPLKDMVEVRVCTGLVAVEARRSGACALLRGVRSVADYEYERNMADVNRVISGMETVLLFAEPQYAAVSSSMVRELSAYGMDVSAFIPDKAIIEQNRQLIFNTDK